MLSKHCKEPYFTECFEIALQKTEHVLRVAILGNERLPIHGGRDDRSLSTVIKRRM